MDSKLKESFDKWEASLDALCRYLLDTGATGPMTANSDRSELVITSSGMPDPLAPVPNTENSLLVVPVDPNETSTMAPVFCSTEGPSHDYTVPTPASTLAAAPTSLMATVGVIPVLAATAAAKETHDGEHIKGTASMDPTPTSDKSPGVAPAVANATIIVAPTFYSKECQIHDLAKQKTAFAPTTASMSLMAIADGVPLWQPLLPAPIPKPPWLLLGHEPVCAYLSCELQKPTGAIHTFYFSPLCHVTSIPMQKIVRNSEMNLFLSRTAPRFPPADQLDGETVATYLNSDDVCTSCWCMITQQTYTRASYLMSYCGGHLHFIELVHDISILLQLSPCPLKKLTCFDNANLAAQECLLATSGCTYEPLSNGKYRECTACFILRRLLHGPGSGCILWMAWYAVKEPYNLEDSFEHHDTAMACSPERVLMSMGACQLFMFWLNFHVKCITRWVRAFNSISFREFLFRWSMASSAMSSSDWFNPIFGWQNVGYTCTFVYGFIHQVLYCSCFSLLAAACRTVMQLGIRWQFFFVSEKSQVAFNAFSDGPIKPFCQCLQTHVQQIYQDQDIVLEIVCKISAKIFKQTWYAEPSSVIYLLVFISASVVHLWRIPWFHFLFLDLTSEELYGLVLFLWEIAWQPGTMDSECKSYYHASLGAEMLDMQRLMWFDILVFSGHNTLGSIYKVFSGGTYRACKVLSYTKFATPNHCQEGIYFKVQHLSYHVVQYIIPDASHCGGEEHALKSFPKQDYEDVFLSSSFHMYTSTRTEKSNGSGELFQWLANNLSGTYQIWLVAWTVDVLEFSTGCGQAPFQGGRNAIQPTFFDEVYANHDFCMTFLKQIHVNYDYYLDQTYYFDTVYTDIIYYHKDCHGDSSMTKEAPMTWDPGKLVLGYPLKLRLGDKPSFKEGGMLGPLPCHPLVRPVTWAHNKGPGPTHSQLQIESYNYAQRLSKQGIQKDQNGTAAAPSPISAMNLHSPSCLFLFPAIESSNNLFYVYY